MSNKCWCIGDVHGCYDTMIALINKLPTDAKIVFCGDLIDRGPKSREVIDYIRYNNIPSVKGNHEDMMCEAIEAMIEYGTPLSLSNWVSNGGNAVLKQYINTEGSLDIGSLMEDYLYLLNLPLIHIDTSIKDEKGRALLVTHSTAGEIIEKYLKAYNIVQNGVTDEITEHMLIDYEHQMTNSEMSMLWGRRLPSKVQENYFNVFGHTPPDIFTFSETNGCLTAENVIIDRDKGYADIDTGCVYHRSDLPMRGVLTAIEFPTMKIIQQENIDAY